MNDFNYIFLLYVARSGSTLFAKQLSQATDDILVVPETKLIENTLSYSESEFAELTPADRVELVRRDPRWENLNIALSEIKKISVASNTRREFIDQLFRFKAQQELGKLPAYVLIKNGASLWNNKVLVDFFKTPLFVHVKRDPRGSTASRMRKMPVYKDKAGARLGDPVFLAKFWCRYIRAVDNLRNSGASVHEVDYDEFVRNTDSEISRFLGSLQLQKSIKIRNNYALSERERQTKHANVERAPMQSRLDAWREDLTKADGVIIEHICRSHVSEPYFISGISLAESMVILLLGYCRHFKLNVERVLEKYTGN